MPTFFDEEARAGLEARLARITPDSPRRWGRMTPSQAVCHLADAFELVMGEREITPVRVPFYVRNPLSRFVALTLPFPWPKGVPTAREADQERAGTAPTEFSVDVSRLRGAMDRFAATGGAGLPPHVIFGPLSPSEWGRWGWRHMDHHLRQFGA